MEAEPVALFDYLYSLGMTVVTTQTHLNPNHDYNDDRIILLSLIHGQTNYSMELTVIPTNKIVSGKDIYY